MGAITSHRRGYGTGYSGQSIRPQNVFWGWSHQNQQLEMMDLPAYLDSMRQTYDAAVSDLSNRLQSLSTMFNQPRVARRGIDMNTDMGHHDCGCGGHDDCGCGCGAQKSDCGCGHDDCGCQCCVEDADVIVYAHCGELRVRADRGDQRHPAGAGGRQRGGERGPLCRRSQAAVAGTGVHALEFLDRRGFTCIPITEEERLGGHLNVVVTERSRKAVGFAQAVRIGAEMARRGWDDGARAVRVRRRGPVRGRLCDDPVGRLPRESDRRGYRRAARQL